MSRPPETLTIEESEKLLVELRCESATGWSAWKYLRNYTMTLLMLDAGLRVGEVVLLTVHSLIISGTPISALNMDEGIAEKKCERIVPLSNRLSKVIADMNNLVWSVRPECQNLYAFFDNDARRHLTTRQVRRIIGSASLAAFGRAIHPHVLRHTFATRLMRVTSTPVVQQLLGHKHISSTQVYTHPNGDDCKKAIDKLNCAGV
jgi:site-specific recombinase XerD